MWRTGRCRCNTDASSCSASSGPAHHRIWRTAGARCCARCRAPNRRSRTAAFHVEGARMGAVAQRRQPGVRVSDAADAIVRFSVAIADHEPAGVGAQERAHRAAKRSDTLDGPAPAGQPQISTGSGSQIFRSGVLMAQHRVQRRRLAEPGGPQMRAGCRTAAGDLCNAENTGAAGRAGPSALRRRPEVRATPHLPGRRSLIVASRSSSLAGPKFWNRSCRPARGAPRCRDSP